MKFNYRDYVDVLRLRLFNAKLGLSEFKFYRLYDKELFNYKRKKEFVGWRYSILIDKKLNNDDWRIFANDKLIFYSIMEAAGLEYPKIRAVFDKQGRSIKSCKCLNQTNAAEYLRDSSNYPVFIKPIHGTYGRGAFSALCYDEAKDTILMGSNDKISVTEVVNRFNETWAEGYLIQEMLSPHKQVFNLVGDRVSSLRIIVLLTDNGPMLFRGVWKFPTGTNMSDNFMHGDTGNLIADIDLSAGKIKNVITGVGESVQEVAKHPDTGMLLFDQPIPLWDEVKLVCLKGASLFPGLKLQHWDIALCQNGPVVLEVNVEGSFDLHQLAGNRGIYDPILRNAMK